MPGNDLKTPKGRIAAFAAFRADVYCQFLTKLRQHRAAEIRQRIAEPEQVTLNNFNREIWQIGNRVLLHGQPISDRIFDSDLNPPRISELNAAIDAGELQVYGNTIWRPGAGVYGTRVNEDAAAKTGYIRQALAIVNNATLAPSEKAEQIENIPGFGCNTATGLTMIAHPNDWALDNRVVRGALAQLGFAAHSTQDVQTSVQQLKAELGAGDYIELDLFLYHLSHQQPQPQRTLNIWWVNQGRSYEDEKARSLIQSAMKSQNNREVGAWKSVEQMNPGDIVLHHVSQHIRAVSLVQTAPQIVLETDNQPRRRVTTHYHELQTPIPFVGIAELLYALHIRHGPVDKRLRPNQGYHYALNTNGLQIVYDASPTNNWPDYVLAQVKHTKNGTSNESAGGTINPSTNPYNALLAALQQKGLSFTPETVSNYLLALQAKGFVIFTGISGTGKTQLALAVAEHFQPTVTQTVIVKPSVKQVEMTVAPYMPEYNRMVLPVALVEHMVLPTLDQKPEDREITLFYPEGKAQLLLYKYPDRNVVAMQLREPFRAWFKKNLPLGTKFAIEVEPDEQGGASDLRIRVPQTVQQSQRLNNVLLIAVRPDWTDNHGLLGYYNPLTRRYESTPFLRFIIEACAEEDLAKQEGRPAYPFFAILDEMNLARVEYYFADFLSAIESNQPLDLHDDIQIEAGIGAEAEQLLIPRKLRVPRNLYFTGTVNVDETTYMFSPKVLDRAFTIEFNHVDLVTFGKPPPAVTTGSDPLALGQMLPQLVQPTSASSNDWTAFGQLADGGLQAIVMQLNLVLAQEQRQFGYRVANEIARFVNLAAAQVGTDTVALLAVLDLAILAKALPKLHGTQQELEPLLVALLNLAVPDANANDAAATEHILSQWKEQNGQIIAIAPDGTSKAPLLPRTAAKLWRMLRRLRQQGFTAFVS